MIQFDPHFSKRWWTNHQLDIIKFGRVSGEIHKISSWGPEGSKVPNRWLFSLVIVLVSNLDYVMDVIKMASSVCLCFLFSFVVVSSFWLMKSPWEVPGILNAHFMWQEWCGEKNLWGCDWLCNSWMYLLSTRGGARLTPLCIMLRSRRSNELRMNRKKPFPDLRLPLQCVLVWCGSLTRPNDVNGKSVHQIMDTFHFKKKHLAKNFQAIALFLSLIFLSVAANWALLKMGQVSPAVGELNPDQLPRLKQRG